MKLGDLVIGFYPQCPKCGEQLTTETMAKQKKNAIKVWCSKCGKPSVMPTVTKARSAYGMRDLFGDEVDE